VNPFILSKHLVLQVIFYLDFKFFKSFESILFYYPIEFMLVINYVSNRLFLFEIVFTALILSHRYDFMMVVHILE